MKCRLCEKEAVGGFVGCSEHLVELKRLKNQRKREIRIIKDSCVHIWQLEYVKIEPWYAAARCKLCGKRNNLSRAKIEELSATELLRLGLSTTNPLQELKERGGISRSK